MYIVKVGKPVETREVMRGANLSSPSIAYRNLQKLLDLGLVVKDAYGNYCLKERVGFKGCVWIGKSIIPRFIVFGLVFIGVLIAEMVVLLPHLIVGAPVEGSFWPLKTVSVIAAMIFLLKTYVSERSNSTIITSHSAYFVWIVPFQNTSLL